MTTFIDGLHTIDQSKLWLMPYLSIRYQSMSWSTQPVNKDLPIL